MNTNLQPIGTRWLVLLTLLAGCSAATHAQEEHPAQTTSHAAPSALIKGFETSGHNPLSPAETALILAPFLQTPASLETLQQARTALESALKARGFGLYRVALPPQELGDKVTLHVARFTVGHITLEGLNRLDENNIRASLPELAEGETPNLQALAIQTSMLNDNDSKKVQVVLKKSAEADKIDVHLKVKEERPWSFSANVANTGSNATGQDRISVVANHHNVFDLDHQLSAAYTSSLEHKDDVKQFGLNYRIALYRYQSVLGLSYTRSDVVGNFGDFSSTGAGETRSISLNHPLPPNGGRRSFINVSVDDKQFNPTRINDIEVPGQAMRRTRPLSMGYGAKVESDDATWAYNTDLALNLSGGNGNDLAAYQSEDPRIRRAHWRALRGSAHYLSGFASGWLWGVRGQFQYSPDALIAGEQFGLGGMSSVRGANERALTGDHGVLISSEISTRELGPGFRLLSFVDMGWLGNNYASDKPEHDSLASIGVGLRYSSAAFSLSADYGRIIKANAPPLAAGASVPKNGDQKVHVNFSARF